jgi:hypothetical protein
MNRAKYGNFLKWSTPKLFLLNESIYFVSQHQYKN